MYRLKRCPRGRWELVQMRPQPDLAGAVVRYSGYVEHAGWSIDNREVASPIVPLIVNFGDPFRIRMGGGAQEHRSFLAGLYDGYADVASTGRAHCMQVDFTPLGAYRFFALPQRRQAACRMRVASLSKISPIWASEIVSGGVTHNVSPAVRSMMPCSWNPRSIAS